MKKTILMFSLLAGSLFVSCNDEDESADSIKAKQVEKELDDLIPKSLSDNPDLPVNNILIYAENGKKGFVYHKAFGFRNQEKTAPAQKQDLFKTGSSSKTFTAAVILQMVEEGKFNLNDPIAQYIGNNPFVDFNNLHIFNGTSYGANITIAQALSHNSGVGDTFFEDDQFIQYVTNNPQQQWSPQTVFEKFYELEYNTKAKFIPGTIGKFYYSDTNYILLGLLIEKVSNNSYASEVRKRVLIPLQMRDTYFEYRETKTTPNEFVETFFGNVNVTRNLNTSFDWAGGGYVTTTLDFKKFIKGLISNKLFKNPTTLAIMTTDYGGIEVGGGLGYGYGINIKNINGSICYGHSGIWGTDMLYSPEKNITLCVSVGQAYVSIKELIAETIKKVDY